MSGASDWEFTPAGPEDEPELRRLLREQPLPGWVTLGFEREPDFHHAAGVEGERHAVLLARERTTGRLAGMHGRAVRRVWFNGEIRRLGYLGQLRLDPALARGRRAYRLLREGFAAGRALRRPDELPFDLTSILADNHRARRILTAGLPGLPRYSEIGGLTTLVLPCRRRASASPAGRRIRPATGDDLPALAAFLKRCHGRYQLAPVWDVQTLQSPQLCRGLRPQDFLLAVHSGEITACLALWDQRAFKQTLVHGYRPGLGAVRPLVNLLTPLLGLPRLPPAGGILRQAWLSHLGWGDGAEEMEALIDTARAMAAQRGLDSLLLGLPDANPLLTRLRRHFRHLAYRSTLYLVHWGTEDDVRRVLDGRPLHVEAAVL